jgi:hypothetical protein
MTTTNTLPVAYTNSHVLTVARHMLAKLAEVSLRDLEYRHSFGEMENTMQVLNFNKKGTHTDTLEEFCIYKETIEDNQLSDKHTIQPNKIF